MAKKQATEDVTPEEQPLRLFVTGAGDGVGLAIVTEAARRGHQVVGATTLGTEGAVRIREAGGLPVYPELERESALYSALMMSRADVVINAAPQRLNGIPQHSLAYDALLAQLDAETEALVAAAGRADIQRIVHLSAAAIYGDTHDAVSEDGHLATDSALGKALHDAEQAIVDGGVPGYVLRCGHIYGVQAATVAVLDAMRSGQPVARGEGVSSWVFTEDVAAVALAIAELEVSDDEPRSTIYNLADDEPMSSAEFLRVLGEAYGTGEPRSVGGFTFQTRLHQVQRDLLEGGAVVNSAAVREALGWQPAYATKEAGIDKLLVYMRAQTAVADDGQTADSDSKELATT